MTISTVSNGTKHDRLKISSRPGTKNPNKLLLKRSKTFPRPELGREMLLLGEKKFFPP